MRTRLAVALSILLVPWAAAAQRAPLSAGETLLEVSAGGSVDAVPDVAEISAGIHADGPNARAAMQGTDAVANGLIAAARGAGVPNGAMRTDSIAVHARFTKEKDGDDTDQILGYRATYRLKLRLADVRGAPAVIDALVRAGATDLEGPSFSFSDDASFRRDARAKAVAAATAEANDYADALHMRVARVLRVSERGANSEVGEDIVVTGSRRTSAPIQPGTQQVSATVWIDYALVPR